jgi:hypothetical protein
MEMVWLIPLFPKPCANSDLWLFIIDGIISFPIAIASFFFPTDLPQSASTRFFTGEVSRLSSQEVRQLIQYTGNPTGSKTNAARRTEDTRGIHRCQGQESAHFIAHLAPKLLPHLHQRHQRHPYLPAVPQAAQELHLRGPADQLVSHGCVRC